MNSPGSGRPRAAGGAWDGSGDRAAHCNAAFGTNHPDSQGVARWFRWAFGAVILCLVLRPGGVIAAQIHTYTVKVAPALDAVEVNARLAADDVRLRASRGRLSQLLEFAGCGNSEVVARGQGLRVRGGCVRYRASLRPGARPPGDWRRVPRFAGHESWLWLPLLGAADVVRIRLVLPEGIQALVPWRRVDEGRYELRASPGSGDAIAFFGALVTTHLDVPGASLPLRLVDAGDGAAGDREEGNRSPLNPYVLKPWLEEAAGLVASVGGRFPNPHAQVVIEPGESSFYGDSPVPFGHVIRSGEEVVRFFVKPQATLRNLREDWTAVHEFSHLLLPYVRDDQKWISEGFASYYQNVLLARAGIYSETEAWRRLSRSFDLADRTGRAPSPNDAHTRSFWDVRMLIYWSGAAMALMGDVELRRQSGGSQSLDSVLGQLAACCLPSADVWEGRALFRKLDALAGREVFVPLYDKYANAPGMPPWRATLDGLGVKGTGENVVLDHTAPLGAIREAILRHNPVKRATKTGAP